MVTWGISWDTLTRNSKYAYTCKSSYMYVSEESRGGQMHSQLWKKDKGTITSLSNLVTWMELFFWVTVPPVSLLQRHNVALNVCTLWLRECQQYWTSYMNMWSIMYILSKTYHSKTTTLENKVLFQSWYYVLLGNGTLRSKAGSSHKSQN